MLRSQMAHWYSDSDRERLNIRGVEKLNSYMRQVERMVKDDMAYADQLLRAILELIDKCKSRKFEAKVCDKVKSLLQLALKEAK